METKWISVKERLPRYAERVILYDSNHRVIYTGIRESTGANGEVFTETMEYSRRVTHWMPLPEPPKI